MNTLTSQNFVKTFLQFTEPPSKELQRRKLRVVNNKENQPEHYFGRNAVIFKLTNGYEFFALKCYITDLPQRWEFLRKVQAIIQKLQPQWTVNFRIFNNELEIEDNDQQKVSTSIIIMPWVEEIRLIDKVQMYCRQQNIEGLKKLTRSLMALANQFEDLPFSHGDVSPENIMVSATDEMMLIDHDSFAFTNMGDYSGQSKGSIPYLHPYRDQRLPDFNADDFSFLVLAISLKALELDPGLYDRYSTSKGLLLNVDDFINPEESKILGELKSMNDPYLSSLLKLFLVHLNKTTTAIPGLFSFLNERIPLTLQKKIDAEWESLLENTARKNYLEASFIQQRVQSTFSAFRNQKEPEYKEYGPNVTAIGNGPLNKNKTLVKKIGMALIAAVFIAVIGGDLFFGNQNAIDAVNVKLDSSPTAKENKKAVAIALVKEENFDNNEAEDQLSGKPADNALAADSKIAFANNPLNAKKNPVKKTSPRINRSHKLTAKQNASLSSNTVTFRNTGF